MVRAAARILAPGTVALALGAPIAGPGRAAGVPSSLTPSDLQFVVSEAQKVQEADVAAWALYRFSRRAEREDYDEDGRVIFREDLEFVVSPDTDGFREDLVRHDGRIPESGEKERHRHVASFNKHYRTLLSGAGEEEEEGGYSLGQLLHLSSYRFAGRETLNGVDCYRLDFTPDDVRPRGSSLAAKFTRAMGGSLWITVEGFHLAGAKAETVRPISIALFLSKVHDLRVSLESGPVGEGVWLPRRLEVATRARILVKPIRRRNLFIYGDFVRVAPPA